MIYLLIFFGLWLGINLVVDPFLYLLVGICFFVFVFKRFLKTRGIIVLCSFCFGIVLSHINFDFNKENFKGVIIEAKDSYALFSSSLEKLYIENDEYGFEVGDILNIQGEKIEFESNSISPAFDFKKYLSSKGVKYELVVKNVDVYFSSFFRINKIKSNFLHRFDETTASILNMILFSSGEIDEINYPFERLHLGRFISSSGMYIYVFINMFTYLFSFFFKKKWAKIFSLLVLIPYFILLFPKFSLLRIVLLQILRWVNTYLLNRRFHYLELVSLTGIFFLLCDFTYAYQDSFVLGFFMPIGFHYSSRAISTNIKNLTLRKICVAISMWIYFIPYEIKYYQEVNILTSFYQIIFTPFFISLGVLSLFSLYFIPLSIPINFIGSMTNSIASFFSNILFCVHLPPFSNLGIILFNIFYYLLIYFLTIKLMMFFKRGLLIISTLFLFYSLPIENYITIEVSFINVGQGDSTLIRYRNTSILIDTGGLSYYDVGKDVLYPFFKQNRIYKIDYLITTHDDFDHVGALYSLSHYMPIKNYITEGESFPLKINDNLILYNYNTYFDEESEDNDKSLVIGFNLSDVDYLIMGDASKNIEKQIMENNINLKCDVLRIGHHGSSTSTSEEFIKFLSPKKAIISVGSNYYGHPSEEVLSILKRNDIEIYRTDIDGTITFKDFVFID